MRNERSGPVVRVSYGGQQRIYKHVQNRCDKKGCTIRDRLVLPFNTCSTANTKFVEAKIRYNRVLIVVTNKMNIATEKVSYLQQIQYQSSTALIQTICFGRLQYYRQCLAVSDWIVQWQHHNSQKQGRYGQLTISDSCLTLKSSFFA